MGEMNHLGHKNHLLKLIEKFEVIVDDGKQGEVHCGACLEPIYNGSVYGCIPCRYFLHKTCAQLEHTFLHDLHALHPLTLQTIGPSIHPWSCDVCDRQALAGLCYCCFPCNFVACIKCVLDAICQKLAVDALKEKAAVKFQHEGHHPQHNLTLQLRPASFYCNACRDEKKDFFYQCDDCDFWIHKTCASLDPTLDLPHHHNHPLLLAYSLPDNFYNFVYYCELCKKRIMQTDWIFLCSNCRYFIHIRCTLKQEKFSASKDDPEVEDDSQEFLQFPMFDAFTDPLKHLHIEKITALHNDDTLEVISHWSHNHPLNLNVVDQRIYNMSRYNDPIEVCHGCAQALSLPYYSCKDGCSFTLHRYCAELPLELEHHLHPDHSLRLINTWGLGYFYRCLGCFGYGNTFMYKCEICKFYLDVNCAFLPKTIKHKTHKHSLMQVMDSKPFCKACDNWSCGISYACKACEFTLDMYCAMRSPHSLAHRYCKGHEIPLTYPPVTDHVEDFYCDICEKEMHPKFPLYFCHNCKNSFHLDCISRINMFPNVWDEGTIVVPYHRHPLTYVRRIKTPKYVCSNCNLDINGYLALECRARVCNFSICYECHYRKVI